jgi:bacterioferritin (cytochrome b1)
MDKKRVHLLLKRSLDAIKGGDSLLHVLSSLKGELGALLPQAQTEATVADLKALATAVSKKDKALASIIGDMSSDVQVIMLLNKLLVTEYLQRDVYEQFSYLLFGPMGIQVREHLKAHMAEEMRHIETLQKYVISLGGEPTAERHPIPLPVMRPYSLRSILQLNLELETKAVSDYSEVILYLESLPDAAKHLPLKIELEDIVREEKEHTMDLERWLMETPQ